MKVEELTAFRDSLLTTMPGFTTPIAYGIGLVDDRGTKFPVTTIDTTHPLPALVLGLVLGYRSGTCTLAVSAGRLDAAIEQLTRIEACEAHAHHHLWSWRDLRSEALTSDGFVAVFVGDRIDRPADDHQRAFWSAAGW